MKLLFANNVVTTLALPISPSALSLVVKAGSGTLFPSPLTGEGFYITLVSTVSPTINEVMLCTARTSDVLVVQRGMDGTTPLAWSANSLVNMYPTKGTMEAFVQTNSNMVTQIIAGTNVSVTPTSGVGAVTVNALGGAVNSVTATSPLTSSGGNNPNISLTGNIPSTQITGLGDMATQNKNNVLITNGTISVSGMTAIQYFNMSGGNF
jgi:hypothetical protein